LVAYCRNSRPADPSNGLTSVLTLTTNPRKMADLLAVVALLSSRRTKLLGSMLVKTTVRTSSSHYSCLLWSGSSTAMSRRRSILLILRLVSRWCPPVACRWCILWLSPPRSTPAVEGVGVERNLVVADIAAVIHCMFLALGRTVAVVRN